MPSDGEVEVAGDCARTVAAHLWGDAETHQLRIIDEEGTPHHMDIPSSALMMLKQVLLEIWSGKIVFVEMTPAEMTLHQAAEILNISHARLVRFLDEGEIPSHKNGAGLRVRYTDVIEHKKLMDAKSKVVLDEIFRLDQEIDHGRG